MEPVLFTGATLRALDAKQKRFDFFNSKANIS